MADQVVDKRTVGIPPDVVAVRLQTREFRDAAAACAEGSAASAEAALTYERRAASHATDADESARQAAMWAEVASMRTLLRPEEPPAKLDGMVWMQTDEQAHTVIRISRWDFGLPGSGLFPGAATYPGQDQYPAEKGAWTSFRFDPSLISAA